MIRNGSPYRVRLASGVLACFSTAAVILLVPAAGKAEETARDTVLIWNEQTSRAIQETGTDPFRASRALALESIAVLDTVRSIASAPGFLVRLPGPRDLKTETAIAAAAHGILIRLFPTQRAALDAVLATSLADEPAGPQRDRAMAFGKAVADAVFARRDGDGWNAKAQATAGTGSSQWRPTPPGYLPPLNPQWATMTPLAMTKASQFRPPGPPATGTAAFRDATAAVAAVGGSKSSQRTPVQTEIARYWTDASFASSTATYWNAVASDLLAPMDLGLEAEAELFAELNVAIADAGIAVADAKYSYWLVRPVTAIREGTAGVAANPDWSPLQETPNHPSYISGTSGFSGAAATVLTARFGTREFSYPGIGAPGVTRSFASFQAAAEEAAQSREYAGIHYAFDNVDGLATGRAVGNWTLSAFRKIADDRGPVIVMDRPADQAHPRAHAPGGFALDNFSPVRTVTVRLDGGERFNVAVDDRGRFLLPKQRLESLGFREAVLVATSGTGRAAVARLQTGGIGDGTTVTAPFIVK